MSESTEVPTMFMSGLKVYARDGDQVTLDDGIYEECAESQADIWEPQVSQSPPYTNSKRFLRKVQGLATLEELTPGTVIRNRHGENPHEVTRVQHDVVYVTPLGHKGEVPMMLDCVTTRWIVNKKAPSG